MRLDEPAQGGLFLDVRSFSKEHPSKFKTG